jgi:hypothetical protein
MIRGRSVLCSLVCAAALLPALAHADVFTQRAKDVTPLDEVCVIENPALKEEFRLIFIRQVESKGYKTRLAKAKDECPVTVTVEAIYARTMSWGPRMVLKTANLAVFRDGYQVGNSTFRYQRGGFHGNGTIESVVVRMVDELLP